MVEAFGPELFWVGSFSLFIIYNLFSSLVIVLFRLSISTWVGFGNLCFSKNVSISLNCLAWCIIVHSDPLLFFFSSVRSMVISPCLFLILVIKFFSLFILVDPTKCMSILLIFFPTFDFIDFSLLIFKLCHLSSLQYLLFHPLVSFKFSSSFFCVFFLFFLSIYLFIWGGGSGGEVEREYQVDSV